MSKNSIHQCSFCGIQIKGRKSNLRRHETLHFSPIKKLKCSICEKTFQTKQNYQVHMNMKHNLNKAEDYTIVYDDAKSIVCLHFFGFFHCRSKNIFFEKVFVLLLLTRSRI